MLKHLDTHAHTYKHKYTHTAIQKKEFNACKFEQNKS